MKARAGLRMPGHSRKEAAVRGECTWGSRAGSQSGIDNEEPPPPSSESTGDGTTAGTGSVGHLVVHFRKNILEAPWRVE